jgi:hypothetical protein
MSNKYSFGILIAVVFLGALTEPMVSLHIGGIRTIVVVVSLCFIFANYQRGDVPFTLAISQMATLNRKLLILLGWYYFGVILGLLRGGQILNFEWKFHATSIFALICGFFLAQNEKYKRVLIYVVMGFMGIHALFANRYVMETDADMRSALDVVAGSLGHTDYWTCFGMLLILCVGYLVEEKNKTIKIIGSFLALGFYKVIFFCGFATPVALFLVAHIMLAGVSVRFGKKGVVRKLLSIILGSILILGSVYIVLQFSQGEKDSRYGSIQSRFSKFIEDPSGGGYEVENSRFNLIYISLATIREDPWFGCGGSYLMNTKTGGHHSIADFLALYGVIGGGGAFILFVLYCVGNAYRRCGRERNWIAFVSFSGVVMYLIVGIVNPGWMGGPMSTLLLVLHPFKMPKAKLIQPNFILPEQQKALKERKGREWQ